MNGDKDERRLRAVLAEYQLTRQEIVATLGRKASLIQFYLIYLATAYGYVLGADKFGLVPLISVGSAAFFAAWLFEHELVILLSTYLRDELEDKKFPKLLTDDEQSELWVDWQHYYGRRLPHSVGWLYRVFAITLFGLFGAGPSLLFSLGVLFQKIPPGQLYLGIHLWPYLTLAIVTIAAVVYCSLTLFAKRTRDIESTP